MLYCNSEILIFHIHVCELNLLYCVQVLFNAALENACSELGARMSAMDSSSRNAGEMLDRLTLTYNRSLSLSLSRPRAHTRTHVHTDTTIIMTSDLTNFYFACFFSKGLGKLQLLQS